MWHHFSLGESVAGILGLIVLLQPGVFLRSF